MKARVGETEKQDRRELRDEVEEGKKNGSGSEGGRRKLRRWRIRRGGGRGGRKWKRRWTEWRKKQRRLK